MGTALRGELTRPSTSAPNQPNMEQNLENIQGVLSQFVRLSQASSSLAPAITVSSPTLDGSVQASTAPWSWTASEAASTEAVLLPFLITLAAAKNDIESLKFCLLSSDSSSQSIASTSSSAESSHSYNIAGGIVNCLEPGSGRSPLHVASLNGSTACVNILLQSGALVHIRDQLGHTALYYVRLHCIPARNWTLTPLHRPLDKDIRRWWIF